MLTSVGFLTGAMKGFFFRGGVSFEFWWTLRVRSFVFPFCGLGDLHEIVGGRKDGRNIVRRGVPGAYDMGPQA